MSSTVRSRAVALPGLRRGVDAAREVLLLGVLYVLYRARTPGRHRPRGAGQGERRQGALVRALAPAAGGDTSCRRLAADVPHLLQAANVYYVSVHFPVTIAFLVWGYLRRPRAEYVWARNVLVTVTGLALLIEFLFPLAPPRMFPQWGFVDTMSTIGPSAYDGAGATLANQYAAMPSLHIGWALTLAVVVHRTGPLVLRVLTKLHAMATVFVVVVTANHWWLDGIVVAALLVLAVALVPRRRLAGPPAAGARPGTRPSGGRPRGRGGSAWRPARRRTRSGHRWTRRPGGTGGRRTAGSRRAPRRPPARPSAGRRVPPARRRWRGRRSRRCAARRGSTMRWKSEARARSVRRENVPRPAGEEGLELAAGLVQLARVAQHPR